MITSLKELGELLGNEMKKNDSVKTQFGSSDVSAYFKFYEDNISTSDRGIRISTRAVDTSSQILIWSNLSYSEWDAFKWANSSGEGFHDWQIVRVINPGRKYVENFNDDFFKDTSSSATWGTTGEVVFGSNEIAISTPIYLNEETLSSATLTASTTGTGSLSYFLSADSGSNWESVSVGVSHTFNSTGTTLLWKASGSDIALQSVEVLY